MRALQVIHSLHYGGSEVMAATLASELGKRGIPTGVCALGENGPLDALLREQGIQSIHHSMPLGASPRLMAKMAWTILAGSFDTVMTHHFRQLLHAAMPAKALRCRTIHVEHDFHSYAGNVALQRKLARLACCVDHFIFVSDGILRDFIQAIPLLAPKAVSIPNGIDTGRFRADSAARMELRERFGLSPETIAIGTTARLEPVKNIGLLLDGFAQLRRTGQTNSALFIFGDGSLRQDLEDQASAMDLRPNVVFAGVVGDTQRWLNLLDIYAITSLKEGLPLSVLEAMATGLPVVATRAGALESLVGPENGVLLQGFAGQELGLALASLSVNPELRARLGRTGRKLVVSRYSKTAMVGGYMRLMQTHGRDTQGTDACSKAR